MAVAESLGGDALLDALRRRAVYASEDEDLALRLYADDRIPMGGAMRTRSGSVKLSLQVSDPGATGHDVRVFLGQVGGASVDVAATVRTTPDAWHEIEVPLDAPGTWFLYLEVHEPRADRMAWSAPIWVERLADPSGSGG